MDDDRTGKPVTIQSVYEEANRCSDHPLVAVPDLEAAETVIGYYRGEAGEGAIYPENYATDDRSFAVGKLPNGQFLAVTEWEDYTGHG